MRGARSASGPAVRVCSRRCVRRLPPRTRGAWPSVARWAARAERGAAGCGGDERSGHPADGRRRSRVRRGENGPVRPQRVGGGSSCPLEDTGARDSPRHERESARAPRASIGTRAGLVEPIARRSRRSHRRGDLDDFVGHLLVAREALLGLLREDRPTFEAHFEHTAVTADDVELQLFVGERGLQFGDQTGRLREVVSTAAVFDANLHGGLLVDVGAHPRTRSERAPAAEPDGGGWRGATPTRVRRRPSCRRCARAPRGSPRV